MQVIGETDSIRISDIQINRSDRVRKDLDPKRIAELADSIKRLGLIHFPVVSKKDFLLVSGETRLEACRSLGWDRIPIQWSENLTEDEHLEIELEENIKRTDLSWQDQCSAMQKYHELKKSTESNWTISKTAESVGVSFGTVQSYLQISAEIESGNSRVVEAQRLSVAKNIVKRKIERATSDQLNQVHEIVLLEDSPIKNLDFNLWAPEYSGPPFNLVHCDFPYGIDIGNSEQIAMSVATGYEDGFSVYEKLINTLKTHREKLLGESAHILFWFSMKHYSYTLESLSEHFHVEPMPLIWHKSDNRGILPDASRGPRRVYETALLCSFGDRKIISPVSNLYSHPTSSVAGHMSEKPEEMLKHFFRMFVDSNTRILDPTCGGGSALRAARSLGASTFLGLEINPEFHTNACRAWKENS